ncbi:hypothetical protein Tco_0751020 [Tanacetum coccineum]|uniref:Uncharacterized protein n=1 Tax=Tanacetum coccineum TaxID=301880 RepID=A0ABQ4Z2W8_9ASTR
MRVIIKKETSQETYFGTCMQHRTTSACTQHSPITRTKLPCLLLKYNLLKKSRNMTAQRVIGYGLRRITSKGSGQAKGYVLGNYGVLGEVMLKGTHFGAYTKSSRMYIDLTENTPYYSRPIRRIQDFDESKDHCLTLKNMPYPHQRYAVYNTLVNEEESTGFTSIRRIHQEDTAYPCLHSPKTTKERRPICLRMDDPNITMEEYIRLEEEKSRKRGKVFNWETAMYGKMWYDEDVHDLISVETESPAIAFNDQIASNKHFLVNPR